MKRGREKRGDHPEGCGEDNLGVCESYDLKRMQEERRSNRSNSTAGCSPLRAVNRAPTQQQALGDADRHRESER